MNTPSPLVPQGTMPTGGKSTIRIAVLTILLVHVALIGGMLIQGCSKDASKTSADEQSSVPTMGGSSNEPQPAYPADTNPAASAPMDTNASNAAIPAMETTTSSVPPFNPATAQSTSAMPASVPTVPATSAEPVVPAPTGATTEYSVVSGDRLSTIAKNHGVSLKALEAANPGVDSRKLKIGQKLQIPAPTAGGASTEGASAGTAATETTIYTVKQGDVLIRIAKTHGTTSKAIMALNHMKSTNIRVGQKLKMPAPKSAAPSAETSAAHTTNN